METLYLIGGMTLVTFSIRYGLLPFSGRIRFSPRMQRALGYVPPAVLTAILVPVALFPDGQTLHFSWQNPYLMGSLATIAIGLLGKNLLITIVGGMFFFVGYQWVLRLILT